MKKFLSIVLVGISLTSYAQKSKYQQDVEAIKAMEGCYKVTFNFAETFSPDTAYKLHAPHYSWGIELVKVIEESKNKLVLQHLLIINDSTIIKHWRQDWLYENTELLQYDKDNRWKKVVLNTKDVKGQWTQKVYQVDDSPRYEGTATWVHVDGKHRWESMTDAPLPRREFSTRSDYNVLRRNNKIYLTHDGWMFEQDNQKVVRDDSSEKLIAWEKGHESFTKLSDDNCLAATNWWTVNESYWNDVRIVWNEVFSKNNSIDIKKKVEDTLLWEKLFKLGNETSKNTQHNSNQSREAIRQIIQQHLNS